MHHHCVDGDMVLRNPALHVVKYVLKCGVERGDVIDGDDARTGVTDISPVVGGVLNCIINQHEETKRLHVSSLRHVTVSGRGEDAISYDLVSVGEKFTKPRYQV